MKREMVVLVSIAVIVAVVGSLYLSMSAEPLPAAVGQNPVPTPASGIRTVDVRVLKEGTYAAGVSARKNYAAYTEENYVKLWTMAYGNDKSALPKVDFSKEYVIGVFAGQKSTGGYGIKVASVVDNGDTRTVAITLTKPGSGCMTTQAVTSPYQLAAVPLSYNALTHTDQEIVTECQ